MWIRLRTLRKDRLGETGPEANMTLDMSVPMVAPGLVHGRSETGGVFGRQRALHLQLESPLKQESDQSLRFSVEAYRVAVSVDIECHDGFAGTEPAHKGGADQAERLDVERGCGYGVRIRRRREQQNRNC